MSRLTVRVQPPQQSLSRSQPIDMTRVMSLRVLRDADWTVSHWVIGRAKSGFGHELLYESGIGHQLSYCKRPGSEFSNSA
jgi:hypothetical protein